MLDQATRLAEMLTLYVLTCQEPGTSLPHGLIQYKVRALTPDSARDQVLDRHPSWQIHAIDPEPTRGR